MKNNNLNNHDNWGSRNVIVELKARSDGEEIAFCISNIFKKYSKYAENRGWEIEVININYTLLGGIKEIVFSIKGENVYSNLKYESEVNRVLPEESYVNVTIMPEINDEEITIHSDEIKIKTFRTSSCCGGLNFLHSVIEITHFPTGISVVGQDERSLLKNKEKAMKILKIKLFQQKYRLKK